MKQSITAIILTKNEEKNIDRCLKSIREHVERIVVIGFFMTLFIRGKKIF